MPWLCESTEAGGALLLGADWRSAAAAPARKASGITWQPFPRLQAPCLTAFITEWPCGLKGVQTCSMTSPKVQYGRADLVGQLTHVAPAAAAAKEPAQSLSPILAVMASLALSFPALLQATYSATA